jgi:hypothetical protein
VLTDVWINEKDQWLISSRHSSQPGLPVNMQSK